jgi:hypothetical protein
MSTNSSGLYLQSVFYKHFDNSFFKKYFDLDDPEIIQLSLSLLEKLYGKGILAGYIERNTGSVNPFNDEDFISFFQTKTHFISIIIKYARLFKDITQDDILRKDFLDNIGLYYAYNQSQEDLDYLFANYVTEVKKRGTGLVAKTKLSGQPVDGELLRLISYLPIDEFLFALLAPEQIGWCIGHSSPGYAGADHITNLIKGYEYSEAIVDLTKYPLSNPTKISIDGDYISIALNNGESAGIEYDSDELKRFVIDPNLDYEISFRVTVTTTSVMPDIDFSVDVYDLNENVMYLQNMKTGDFSLDNKFATFTPNLFETEYWVRGMIFKKGTVYSADDLLNIGIGNNFNFSNNEKYIIPKIIVTANSNTTVVKIKDFKVRLGLLPFSLGQLGLKRLVVSFLNNNSGKTDSEINTIIRNELLPYNVIFEPINL